MKILYVTTISLTVNTFFKKHIDALVKEGNQVDIACNYKDLALDTVFSDLGCNLHHINFSRNPLSFDNVKAFSELKKVIKKGEYDIVHCHTPNASVITRLVCRKFRKKGRLKVFYTAHGFHFYKGAPKLNWMVYYPIEKFCSRYTDKLITINQEDYNLAKEKFRAGEVCYIPGVGIDLSRFENVKVDRAAKRKEIGVPEESFLLLSVGELNENKNHQIIIRALAKIGNPNVHYAVAGVGDKKDSLLALAEELGVSDRIHLLGYRKDIPELNHSADAFCFPSYREGLGLAAIEAMACGLPIVTSNIHGINDYSIDGVTGYKCSPSDASCFAENIQKLIHDRVKCKQMGENNKSFVKMYDIGLIVEELKRIYQDN